LKRWSGERDEDDPESLGGEEDDESELEDPLEEDDEEDEEEEGGGGGGGESGTGTMKRSWAKPTQPNDRLMLMITIRARPHRVCGGRADVAWLMG
jgi:hypothetical protein